MDEDFPTGNTGAKTQNCHQPFFAVLYFKALKDPDSFRTQLNIKFKVPELKCHELKFSVLDIVTPRHTSLAWEPLEPTWML